MNTTLPPRRKIFIRRTWLFRWSPVLLTGCLLALLIVPLIN
jgi:hypothetical protein